MTVTRSCSRRHVPGCRGADLLGVDHDVRHVVDEDLILHAVPGTPRRQIDYPYARRGCLRGLGHRYRLVRESDGDQAVVGCDTTASGFLDESRRSDARLAGTLEADPPDATPWLGGHFIPPLLVVLARVRSSAVDGVPPSGSSHRVGDAQKFRSRPPGLFAGAPSDAYRSVLPSIGWLDPDLQLVPRNLPAVD